MRTITLFAFLIIALQASLAQTITGPSPVVMNTTNQYQYYDDAMLTNPVWSSPNGTVVSQWQTGATYYCTISWAATGTQTLSLHDGATLLSQLNVQVTNCASSTPTTTFTFASTTTNVNITRSSNPPTGYSWYWQTVATGSSMANGTATYSGTSGNTYYLRTRDNASGCWSSASLSVAVLGNPTVTPAARCGTGTVTLTATTGSGGTNVRWYSAATGGTLLLTGTNFTTPTISTTTTYYASSYKAQGGALSQRIPVVATVDVPTVAGTITGSNEGFGSGTLTLSGHTGALVRWEKNEGAGWTAIASTANPYSYSGLFKTTQFRAVVKSGTTCSELTTNALRMEMHPLPYGSTVTLQADAAASYEWRKNGAVIVGANQQTYTTGTPDVYTVRAVGATTTATAFSVVHAFSLQSNAVNGVSTTRIMKAGLTANSSLYTLAPHEVAQAISYQDGMGRTFQVIGVGQSPNRGDVVAATVHGKQGLTDTTYLPFVTTLADGRYRTSALRGSNNLYSGSEQYLFYQNTAKVATDTKPFARTLYRNSPDAKVVEQGAPGNDWQPGTNHTVRNTTAFNNTTYPVRLWQANGTTTGNYPVGSVAVSITTDENGNKVRTFTNALGQTVLKQVQLDDVQEGVTVNWLDTYYIYDVYGRLKYILPPKALKVLGTGATLDANHSSVAELIHTFVYDARGRVVEKKVPGSAVQFLVYDKHDRVVLTQDGHQRASNQWLFVKYDFFDRVAYSGLYTNTTQTTRTAVQALLDALNYNTTPWYESEGTAVHGYTNNAFPTTGTTANTVLSVSYYDHYNFDRTGGDDFTYDNTHLSGQEATRTTATRGMATGSKRVTLNASGNATTYWITNVVFYDKRGRPIQTQTNNHLHTGFTTATLDKNTVVYDFVRAIKTKTSHYQNATTAVHLEDRTEVDHAGRVLKTFRKINSGTEQLVVQYEYNALGQLVDKKLHLSSPGEFLQSIDMRYNIRGWLKSINNAQLTNDGTSNDETNDYFGMELVYNEADGVGNTPYYNGNISALKWKAVGGAPGASDQRSYKYNYDKTDRLKTAGFAANNGTAWTKESGTLDESMSYDVNGNITALSRKRNLRGLSGVTVTSTPETIDNLAYTYASNLDKLTKVEDAATAAGGFANGTNTTTEYNYNTDGSLTADNNKGVSAITYNLLGKPQQMTFTDGRTVTYTYDAAGSKLTMTTVVSGQTTITTYAGSFVYTNNTLSFFGSPEGRVVPPVGGQGGYVYEYAITDHQGNTRVVFSSAAPNNTPINASFEGDGNDQTPTFTNVDAAKIVTNVSAATSGTKTIRMNQTYKIGPTKSVHVYAGDKIDLEVWEYHEGSSGYGTSGTALGTLITAVATSIGGVNGGAGEAGLKYNGVSSAFNGFGTGGNQGDARPAAYLNYILFDKTYKVLDAGWQLAPAATFTKQKISFPTKTITEEGYMVAWLSYDDDSNNWVYFDDFKVTHTKSNIIQYNEYYPFGLQTANSWTRENATGNNFLGNGGTELNTTSNLYDLEYRNYDPVLGRMNGVDPMATKYASLTPYNFSFNDPVTYSDPSGAEPPQAYGSRSPYHTFYTNDDRVDSYMRGDFHVGGNSNALLFHTGGRSGRMSNYVSSWNPDYGGPVAYTDALGNTRYAFQSTLDWVANHLAEPMSLEETMVAIGEYNLSVFYDMLLEIENTIDPSQMTASTNGKFINNKPSRQAIALAMYIRATPVFVGQFGPLPFTPNPFWRAEAIFSDAGLTLAGTEIDAGMAFILIGNDIGRQVPFKEYAGGLGGDAGVSIELGRIDVDRDPELFTKEYLFGERKKGYTYFNTPYASVGGGIAISYFGKYTVIATSVQIGWGPSWPPWGGGWNKGKIAPIDGRLFKPEY